MQKKIKEYTMVYLIGSIGYSLLEFVWRGFTHWTMAITGGICLLCLYGINVWMPHQKLWKKCLVGTAMITIIEFVVGCIVNRALQWKVWDYSQYKINLLGQVCLFYSLLWFLLCIPVIYLCGFLKKKLFP